MEAILNFLGILKERSEVERVELEVLACLSLSDFTRAQSWDDRQWEEWGRGNGERGTGRKKRERGTAESSKWAS